MMRLEKEGIEGQCRVREKALNQELSLTLERGLDLVLSE